LACSVIVEVFPLVTDAELTLTSDVAGEIGPGTGAVTVIVGNVDAIAEPFTVAPIDLAVPAPLAVNVAVYVPFALSVTAPKVPVLVPAPSVNATVAPPVVIAFPAASFSVAVTVVVAPAATVPVPTETVDCTGEGGPGVTVKVGMAVVTAAPSSAAAIERAVPAVVAVSVAEYVPLPLSTTAPIVPALVPPAPSAKATLAPPEPIVAPDASFVVSVMVADDPDAMVALEIVTVEVAAEGSGPSPPSGSVPPLHASSAAIPNVNEKRAVRSRSVAADIIPEG
jgi:hypothetical protein